MADKPFCEMTDEELKAEFAKWNTKVEEATGWGAAYAQALKWAKACKRILSERGISVEH